MIADFGLQVSGWPLKVDLAPGASLPSGTGMSFGLIQPASAHHRRVDTVKVISPASLDPDIANFRGLSSAESPGDPFPNVGAVAFTSRGRS